MAQCVALYEYAARDSEELTISKNENLVVLDSSGAWWRVRNERGTVGLVPSNYVEKLATQQPQMTHTILEKEDPHMYHQPDLVMPKNGPSLNIVAQAKYNYFATREDELSLEKGDEVIVIEKEADGWWRGRCGARLGWFPFNYVEEIATQQPQMTRTILEKEDPHMYQPHLMMPKNGPSLNTVAQAKYKYIATREDELSLEKGDEVIVIEKEADGWWRGQFGARIGWFPFNYVEEIATQCNTTGKC